MKSLMIIMIMITNKMKSAIPRKTRNSCSWNLHLQSRRHALSHQTVKHPIVITCKCSSNSRFALNTSWVSCWTLCEYSSWRLHSCADASSFSCWNLASTLDCDCSYSLILDCKMLISLRWSVSPSSLLLHKQNIWSLFCHCFSNISKSISSCWQDL